MAKKNKNKKKQQQQQHQNNQKQANRDSANKSSNVSVKSSEERTPDHVKPVTDIQANEPKKVEQASETVAPPQTPRQKKEAQLMDVIINESQVDPMPQSFIQ